MFDLTTEHIFILVASFAAAFVFGYFYRLALRRFKAKNVQMRAVNNIGKADRLVRLVLGIFLLILGLVSWNPIILFFSGFCFYEATVTWCGFYALTGTNTCKIN